MTATQPASAEQAALWNGAAGLAWVETQELMDQALAPFEHLLVEAVRAARPRRVLDVGCGTGSTTLAVAQSLGADAHGCVGVDISEPMLALARARAAHAPARAERAHALASFICADAQTHAFDAASFDLIVSRFGVMFFDDPVRAFANLRRAACAGAELRLLAWRSPEDNAFMTAAERAAAPLLPPMPPRRPDAPGQFAFADRARVQRILEESGWTAVDFRPIDVVCAFPAKELERYVTRLGPLSRILPELDERTRHRIVETVRSAFDAYVHGDEVRFDAGCWMIGARAPSA